MQLSAELALALGNLDAHFTIPALFSMTPNQVAIDVISK
jgi:sorbitol-specific phosphotransferase system component IIBC